MDDKCSVGSCDLNGSPANGGYRGVAVAGPVFVVDPCIENQRVIAPDVHEGIPSLRGGFSKDDQAIKLLSIGVYVERAVSDLHHPASEFTGAANGCGCPVFNDRPHDVPCASLYLTVKEQICSSHQKVDSGGITSRQISVDLHKTTF